MKPGLILPAINSSDVQAFKNDPRSWWFRKQIALEKQSKEKEKKMLDNWLHSAHTHKSSEKLTIKLGDK